MYIHIYFRIVCYIGSVCLTDIELRQMSLEMSNSANVISRSHVCERANNNVCSCTPSKKEKVGLWFYQAETKLFLCFLCVHKPTRNISTRKIYTKTSTNVQESIFKYFCVQYAVIVGRQDI